MTAPRSAFQQPDYVRRIFDSVMLLLTWAAHAGPARSSSDWVCCLFLAQIPSLHPLFSRHRVEKRIPHAIGLQTESGEVLYFVRFNFAANT